jgi:hypothetical protein
MFDRILLAAVMCACSLIGYAPHLATGPAAACSACACEDVYDWVTYDFTREITSEWEDKTYDYIEAVVNFDVGETADWQYQGGGVWHVYGGPFGEQYLHFVVRQLP